MNTIKGGSLEFEITANAGKLSDVLEETKRRIQGFSDATAAGGEDMEKAFEQAAATIERAWRDIDAMSDIHKAALADLQKQYAQVGKAAGEAFMRGTADGDKEYRQLIKQQDAIGQQISQRQKLIKEINETADALLKEEANFEKVRDKVDKAASSKAKLTTELRNITYEIAQMEEAGQRGSEAYNKLTQEAARLTNALRDARTQAKILSHDNAGLQGVIAGVSGVAGAFSAAQGAVALFSGENENLQKIMLRVQSLMGITIGLQQVANTLNKDSAFRLVTIAKAQEWWNTVKAKALIATTADTAATAANTAAKTTNTAATAANAAAQGTNTAATAGQAAAATAATAANIGLAGAFRLVGAAIASIPGIGWLLAGIAGLVALYKGLTKETREAKKQQKEMNQAVAEVAGKPLAAIQQLSKAYSKLGDDLKAKEKFIDENRDKFDQLGVAVNSVKDAENLLMANKKAFIESQIMKAKSLAATELAAKKYKEALEKTMNVQEPNKYRGTGANRGKTFDAGSLIQEFGRSQSADSLLAAGKIEINPAWEEYNKKVEKSFADANKLFEQAAQFSLKEKQILEQIGQSLESITAGSITALENNITKLNEKYKLAKTDDAREALAKEIQEQQALLEKIDVLQKTGGTTTKSGGDPFLEILEARKKKYEEYFKWVNSGDEIVRKAAQKEFAGLLEEGSSYLDYLKKQREQLTEAIGDDEATQRKREELRKLNAAIATETKDTVLAQFEADLQAQLSTAENVLQMFDIIQKRRDELSGDGSDVDTGKSEILEKAQKEAAQQAETEAKELLEKYGDYLAEKLEFEADYAANSRLLNQQLEKAKTDKERQIAQEALKGLEADRLRYAKQTGSREYDLLVEQYQSFQQRREAISKDYDDKIALATKNSNQQLVDQLTEERDRKLSRVALEELQDTKAWTQILGNLDDLTTEQLNRIIQQIEAQRATLGVELDTADLQSGYLKVAQTEQEAAQMIGELNEESREAIKGSITYYRELIKDKTEAMEILTDPEAITAARKEIEELQATLNKIQGTAKTTTSKAKDPLIEQLEERKKKYQEYYKWVNSGDQIIRKAAEQEFAGLLTEGATYLEYLKNQRDQLTAAIGDDAATQRKREELRKLNAAIATETKDTVLAQFEADLQAQLATAENVMQMLDIIQQRRQEIAGDSTDLGSGKSDILDKAQQDAAQQAEDQTRELLDQYTDYLQEKIAFEANYAENSRLLNAQLAKAKTEEERLIARAALAGLEADRIKYAKQTGSKEYDLMVEQYRSFEQRRTDIAAEYDRKIAEATRNNNAQLAEQLATERDKSLSRVALEELQNSDAWTQLLGNLDDLTVTQLQKIIAQVEAEKAALGVELDAADLETVLTRIKAARDEIQERNPFKALATAVKEYGKEANGASKKADLNRIFEAAAGSIDLVKGAFDSVVGGLTEMGMAGDEVTQKLLGDISELIGSAEQLAIGIATENPMAIIQGGIGVITGAFKVFNSQDRAAERALKRHANAVQDLEKGYRNLERAVDKALGESVYKSQQALISNLQQQRYHMQQMWMAEESKKRADKDKIEGYKEQYQELGYQIEDTIASIAESITQTSAKDMAGQLADTIAEAFTQGFDSANVAKAIEEVTNNVMRNAVKKALTMRFLEEPMQDAVKQLQKAMGFDESGAGAFDGLTPQEQQAFKDRVKGIASTYSEAMKMYEDLFKDMEREAGGDPTTSLAGAIKGASQESIDLLAGQTNAVRIQQAHSIDLLRDQLIHLASIDSKIGISNELLSNIYNSLRTQEASDPLRAQGITL